MWILVILFLHFILHDSWMLIYILCVVTMPSPYYAIDRYGKNEVKRSSVIAPDGNSSFVGNEVDNTRKIISRYTLRFINCVHIYVRTDKFCFVVDGHARKFIWHCLSCEMGFLGARVQNQNEANSGKLYLPQFTWKVYQRWN